MKSSTATNLFKKTFGNNSVEIQLLKDTPRDWNILPFMAAFKEHGLTNEFGKVTNVLSLSYGNIINRDIETNFGLLPASFETYQVVHPGWLIFRLTDLQNDQRSLRTGLVKEEGIITSAYLAASPTKELNSEFAAYLMRAYDISKIFYSMGGGVRQSIDYSDLRHMPVIIPPIPEQKNIVKFLNKKCDSIDASINRKYRLIELLQEKRSSLIINTITLGMDPNEKLTNKNSWFYKTPSRWAMKPLKYLFAYHFGGTWGEEAQQDENDVICIRVADFDFLTFGVSDSDFTYRNIELDEPAILDNNSILLEKSGGGEQTPVGRAVKYLGNDRATCSNFIEKLQVAPGNDRGFVVYLLATLYFSDITKRSIKQTTGIQNLDLTSFLRERVPVPSLKEQHDISLFLDSKNEVFVNAIKSIEEEILKLKELRASLVYSTVTGKIRI